MQFLQPIKAFIFMVKKCISLAFFFMTIKFFKDEASKLYQK